MQFKKIRAVIFDLDGTLLNTIDGITASVNAALALYGFPPRSVQEVRRFVGNGLRRTLEQAIPGGEAFGDFETALRFLIQDYEKNCMRGTVPYPGVCPLLSTLRASGLHLGIVSNKTDPAVQELRDLFFRELVDVAIGEKPGVCRKPAPDAVLAAMTALQAAPEESVYVGDSEVDLLTAQNSGIPCISVLWGYRDAPLLEKAGASRFARSASEIPALLQQLDQELCL